MLIFYGVGDRSRLDRLHLTSLLCNLFLQEHFVFSCVISMWSFWPLIVQTACQGDLIEIVKGLLALAFNHASGLLQWDSLWPHLMGSLQPHLWFHMQKFFNARTLFLSQPTPSNAYWSLSSNLLLAEPFLSFNQFPFQFLYALIISVFSPSSLKPFLVSRSLVLEEEAIEYNSSQG